MKKISLLLYYFLAFVYLEVIFKIFMGSFVIKLSIISMIAFLGAFSLIMYIINKLWGEKFNKFLFYTFLSLICLWFSAQFVVKDFFDFYISFSVLKIAKQVNDFLDIAVVETFKRIIQILFLFMPLIVGIILRKKISFRRCSFKKISLMFIFLLMASGMYYGSIFINKSESNSVYDLFFNVNNPTINIEKVGVLNTFCVDIYRTVFGFEEKIILTNLIPNDNKEPDVIDIVYKYNNLDFDFERMLNEENDNKIVEMTKYFQNEPGTKQNEYTGFFKDKNLIMFMAESFSEIAVSETLTPTLYKLVNNGFVFENFYSPTIFSTIGGEFQEVTGLYPAAYATFKKGTTYFPMGLGTVFKENNYLVKAYHNNTYTFQNRNLYLNSLGFDSFVACRNGLEEKINCKQWPQSDVEMIEATVDDYINSEVPFMTYYVSVSGHSGYTWGNAMSKKHKAEIEALNLGYSEGVLAYLAAQMELDKALEVLIQKLTAAGKLENTVIALVGDHYPYALSVDEVNEAASYQKDSGIEVNRSNFILYNSAMEPTNISKVGSQIDVIPTIYNVFGINYDSRLIIGKDILSTEPGLAMFGNRSWVSDKGKYFSSGGKFESKNGEEVDEEYIKIMNQIVNNKINMSKYIVEKDYYKYIWKYKR